MDNNHPLRVADARNPVRIAQYGLGRIGLACAGALLDKEASHRIKLVGAIDIDPEKAGRALGELLQRPCDIVVSSDADQALSEAQPHVVIHTTSSFLERTKDQLLQCASHGAHMVSSTEELSFPFDRHPHIAAELDRVARKHRVAMLGTGVNPGYAMDTLALMATGVCTDVRSIRVKRIVDASKRRFPLQKKIGAGLSVNEFRRLQAAGDIGHIGLRESLLLVASGLDWSFDRIEESLDPMIARERVKTPFLEAPEGRVTGIHQTVTGFVRDVELLSLELKMYVGARNPVDSVQVEGTPPINLAVSGGIFGDTATVATLVNAIPLVISASPGLHTVKDLPVPRAFASAPSWREHVAQQG